MCKACFNTSYDEIAAAVNNRRTKAGMNISEEEGVLV